MVKLARDIQKTSMISMHPALDFVGGVAYAAVNITDEEKGIITVVVSSKGDIWDMEEWTQAAKNLGFNPKVKEVSLDEARWNQEGILELVDTKKLKAPDFKQVYDAIIKALDERLVLVDRRYLTILALYGMVTYFHPLFKKFPILHLLGPSESGKTIALVLLGEFAFNGHVAASATPSSLFRMAHEKRETQIITEADDLAEKTSGDSFIKQLQGGTTVQEATVTLTETSNTKAFKPVQYYTFNPKALGSTKTFKAPTLRNRCIVLHITKTAGADQQKLRKEETEVGPWEDTRNMLYRLLFSRWGEVEASRIERLKNWTGPTGRVFDKFLPLAAVAKLVSEEVFNIVHELAMENMREQQRDARNSFDGLINRFARQLVKTGDRKLTAQEIFDEFLRIDIPHASGLYGPSQREIDDEPPIWAKELGLTVNNKWLSERVKDREILVYELQRRDLIPMKKEKQRTSKGNPYALSQKHIEAKVKEYIGKEEEEEEEEEAAA